MDNTNSDFLCTAKPENQYLWHFDPELNKLSIIYFRDTRNFIFALCAISTSYSLRALFPHDTIGGEVVAMAEYEHHE